MNPEVVGRLGDRYLYSLPSKLGRVTKLVKVPDSNPGIYRFDSCHVYAINHGSMVESVYTPDLRSGDFGHEGSTPSTPTKSLAVLAILQKLSHGPVVELVYTSDLESDAARHESSTLSWITKHYLTTLSGRAIIAT